MFKPGDQVCVKDDAYKYANRVLNGAVGTLIEERGTMRHALDNWTSTLWAVGIEGWPKVAIIAERHLERAT